MPNGKPSDEIRLLTNGTDQALNYIIKAFSLIFLNLCCMNEYDWFTRIFLRIASASFILDSLHVIETLSNASSLHWIVFHLEAGSFWPGCPILPLFVSDSV